MTHGPARAFYACASFYDPLTVTNRLVTAISRKMTVVRSDLEFCINVFNGFSSNLHQCLQWVQDQCLQWVQHQFASMSSMGSGAEFLE